MKKTTTLECVLLILTLFLISFSASAQWESTDYPNYSTWGLVKMPNGNIIVLDDQDRSIEGKLFISRDNTNSWEECDVEGYAYACSATDGESAAFGGVMANVAITHDNGESWTTSNFAHLYPQISPDYPTYAIEYHNGRIYASVLGLGIAYTEDAGKTWNPTDRKSLVDQDNPDNGGQWCYKLISYKGKLYNLGTFGIWEYDEDSNFWTRVFEDWYINDAFIHNDALFITYNAPSIPEAIRYTTDMENWESIPIPEEVSTSIRVIRPYGNVLFLGHTGAGVYYTSDLGETWTNFSEGFPGRSPVPGVTFYDCPMGFVFMDNYIYCSVFAIPGLGGMEYGVTKIPVPNEVITYGKVEYGVSGGSGILKAKKERDAISSGEEAEMGTILTFYAYPDDDQRVKEWKINGKAVENYKKEQLFVTIQEPNLEVTVEFEEGSGIETLLISEVAVYPNPTNDFITFRFNSAEDSNISICITDITGRIVYKTSMTKSSNMNEKRINVEDWNRGTYIYTIQTQDKRNSGKLIIK